MEPEEEYMFKLEPNDMEGTPFEDAIFSDFSGSGSGLGKLPGAGGVHSIQVCYQHCLFFVMFSLPSFLHCITNILQKKQSIFKIIFSFFKNTFSSSSLYQESLKRNQILVLELSL